MILTLDTIQCIHLFPAITLGKYPLSSNKMTMFVIAFTIRKLIWCYKLLMNFKFYYNFIDWNTQCLWIVIAVFFSSLQYYVGDICLFFYVPFELQTAVFDCQRLDRRKVMSQYALFGHLIELRYTLIIYEEKE